MRVEIFTNDFFLYLESYNVTFTLLHRSSQQVDHLARGFVEILMKLCSTRSVGGAKVIIALAGAKQMANIIIRMCPYEQTPCLVFTKHHDNIANK